MAIGDRSLLSPLDDGIIVVVNSSCVGWRECVEAASDRDIEKEGSIGLLRYQRVAGTHFTIL